jgi:RNA polymerase sigma-70 factor (ECF subfamily)
LAQLSDEQLVELFRSGSENAFAQLVRRYERELYNFLMKFLGQSASAEDVFQETFLQVHLSAGTFESGRRFRPWLYTIAANKARDLLRSQARRPTVQLTPPDDDTDIAQLWEGLLKDTTTPEQQLQLKQRQEFVREVIGQLPGHLREILILAYYNQLSYKELAEVLGIPLGTVKSRLHSALTHFARLYHELSTDDERIDNG